MPACRHRVVPFFVLAAVAVTPVVVGACRKKDLMTAKACEALLTVASGRSSGAGESSNACTTDTDCIEVPTPRCLVGCGGQAVSKPFAPALRDAVEKANANECKQWDEEHCENIAPRPVPSCPHLAPRCRSRTCTMVDDRVLPAQECSKILQRVAEEHRSAVAAADKSCKTVEDCTSVFEPLVHACRGDAIAKTAEPGYGAKMKKAGEALDDWRIGGCATTYPLPVPSCGAWSLQCRDGVCANEPFRPPPSVPR